MAFPNIPELLTAKEYWHPIVSHFPLSMWLSATVIFMISLLPRMQWLYLPSLVVGMVGTALGWLAYKTGHIAQTTAGVEFLDVSKIAAHKEQAEITLVFFGATFVMASLLLLIKNYVVKSFVQPTWLKLILAVGLMLGCSYLTLTTHKGLQLAFDQPQPTEIKTR